MTDFWIWNQKLVPFQIKPFYHSSHEQINMSRQLRHPFEYFSGLTLSVFKGFYINIRHLLKDFILFLLYLFFLTFSLFFSEIWKCLLTLVTVNEFYLILRRIICRLYFCCFWEDFQLPPTSSYSGSCWAGSYQTKPWTGPQCNIANIIYWLKTSVDF